MDHNLPAISSQFSWNSGCSPHCSSGLPHHAAQIRLYTVAIARGTQPLFQASRGGWQAETHVAWFQHLPRAWSRQQDSTSADFNCHHRARVPLPLEIGSRRENAVREYAEVFLLYDPQPSAKDRLHILRTCMCILAGTWNLPRPHWELSDVYKIDLKTPPPRFHNMGPCDCCGTEHLPAGEDSPKWFHVVTECLHSLNLSFSLNGTWPASSHKCYGLGCCHALSIDQITGDQHTSASWIHHNSKNTPHWRPISSKTSTEVSSDSRPDNNWQVHAAIIPRQTRKTSTGLCWGVRFHYHRYTNNYWKFYSLSASVLAICQQLDCPSVTERTLLWRMFTQIRISDGIKSTSTYLDLHGNGLQPAWRIN